ncbi:MAG: carboxypeptidase regulatory-like domain-containing protein [Anaeromyxobacter sp.]
MRKLVLVAAALAAASSAPGCRRDTSLPPPPQVGAGSLSGRVVFAQPGSQDKQPASRARVELLGTGRVIYADVDGRFVFESIDFTPDPAKNPPLLLQYDPGGTGIPSKQKLVDLGAFSPKAGLQLSLGDVAVSENAKLRGRFLRGDNAASGGHAGTVVYVPQGPFTTFTADDGSFELTNLPEGTISVAAFRTGFQSVVVDEVTLRAGELVQMRDFTLEVVQGSDAGAPGKLRGTVTFDPAPAASGDTTVVAADPNGKKTSVVAGADGAFLLDQLAPGIYQVTASRTGYEPAIASNVALAPNGDVTVAGLRLVQQSSSTCIKDLFCQPEGADNVCKTGRLDCTAGTTCVPTGYALEGKPCGPGATCRSGVCKPICTEGTVCIPSANKCHLGQNVCAADGTASCLDLLAVLRDGTVCGTNSKCFAGVCTECTGTACEPVTCTTSCTPDANKCHEGTRTCSGTTAGACTDTGLAKPDGTGCGTNQVCGGGVCNACAAGVGCMHDNFCKLGVVQCSTGFLVCADGGNKPDGTACGASQICRQGFCTPAGGQVSTLATITNANASTRNPVVASNGDVYFADYYNHTVKRLPAGKSTPEVIAGIPAQAGVSADNQPAVQAKLYYPFSVALDEANALLYVSDSYNDRIRAIQLNGNRWIVGIAGDVAQPAPGYGDGGAAAQADLATPTSMAIGKEGTKRFLYFFDSGHGRFRRIELTDPPRIDAWSIMPGCSAPVSVSSCSGGNVYNDCGLASAGDGGMFVSGYLCGTEVGTATYGIVRVPPPGAGGMTRVLGKSAGITTEGGYCLDTTIPDPAGLAVDPALNLYYTNYGTNVIRRVSPTGTVTTVAGTGAQSTTGDGGSALAASFNGPTSLTFGGSSPTDAVIAETKGNVLRLVLGLGSSAVERGTLSTVSGGTQTVLLGQTAPGFATVKLVDPSGSPLAGYVVNLATTSATPGFLVAKQGPTSSTGTAGFDLRVGFKPGPYTFEVSYRDVFGVHVNGSPQVFTVTATPPPAGTIMSVVNEDRVTDTLGVPGFGPRVHAYYPRYLTAAPDGMVYFTTYYGQQVLALTPEGYVRAVAGTGSAGFSGDGGLATQAQLYYPSGLALDDAGNVLYIADEYNHRVRAVNLASGIISTLAGNGTAANPSTGDGGPALSASLYYPLQLAQRGGKLYVAENGQKIRVVDLTAATPTIGTALQDSQVCTGAVQFRGCTSSYACGLAVDASGALYASAYLCGASPGGSAYGIVRWDGTTLTHVAGRIQSGSTDNEGTPAQNIYLSEPPGLSFGPGGRLFLADMGGDVIRFLDQLDTAPRNRRWFGAGTQGFAGNYASVVTDPFAIQLYNPTQVVFTPAGDAVITDYQNQTVRLVYGAASVLP